MCRMSDWEVPNFHGHSSNLTNILNKIYLRSYGPAYSTMNDYRQVNRISINIKKIWSQTLIFYYYFIKFKGE